MVRLFCNKVREPICTVPTTVVNLSDFPLLPSEHRLLEKGLNFCRTPGEAHMGDLRRDLDNFHRNLRIKSFFDSPNKIRSSTSTPNFPTPTYSSNLVSDVEKDIRKSKILKPDKKWTPPMGPIHLEAFILANEIDLNKTIVRSPIGHHNHPR